MALADSAVHLVGADYLIRHGQDYAHLDLAQLLRPVHQRLLQHRIPVRGRHAVRRERLPARAAADLGLPAAQRVHARARGRSGLGDRAAHRARRGARGRGRADERVPALVYGYELIGSIKEITALPMMLDARGARRRASQLAAADRRAGRVPAGSSLAAGVSALGVAFGVWALVAAAVLAVDRSRELSQAASWRRRARCGGRPGPPR